VSGVTGNSDHMVEGTPGGANRGRGEDWLTAQLRRRGHAADQQRMVWRNDQVGRYYIDVSVGEHAAIELYSYWHEPWLNDRQLLRVHNLALEGWHVLYVWLRQDQYPTDAAVDAAVQWIIDTNAGSHHSFRVVDYNGEILRVGWLDRTDQLVSTEPDEKPQWPVSEWSEDPPEPPPVPRPSGRAWRVVKEDEDETPEEEKERFDEANAVRKLWWDYERAFEAWGLERERRRAPWEVLPVVRPRRSPRSKSNEMPEMPTDTAALTRRPQTARFDGE
jgi:hypothetical protein